MKTYSETQKLLLKQLGIAPLVAKAELFLLEKSAEAPLSSAYQPVTDTGLLADDIRFLIKQTSITDWFVDFSAQRCRIEAAQLFTPAITELQHSVLKQQLWQLLSEHLHD